MHTNLTTAPLRQELWSSETAKPRLFSEAFKVKQYHTTTQSL